MVCQPCVVSYRTILPPVLLPLRETGVVMPAFFAGATRHSPYAMTHMITITYEKEIHYARETKPV